MHTPTSASRPSGDAENSSAATPAKKDTPLTEKSSLTTGGVTFREDTSGLTALQLIGVHPPPPKK